MQLLSGLDKEERRLFHDRIRQLDRSVLPATHTLTWASPKHALDFYFREANLCGPPSLSCESGTAAHAAVNFTRGARASCHHDSQCPAGSSGRLRRLCPLSRRA